MIAQKYPIKYMSFNLVLWGAICYYRINFQNNMNAQLSFEKNYLPQKLNTLFIRFFSREKYETTANFAPFEAQ